MQNMGMRRDVAQPLEHGESKIGGRHLKREALADQTRKLGLVLERVKAGNDATGAVPQEENGQARLPRFRHLHDDRDVADIVRELLGVETLAVGFAATAQV